MIRGILKFLFLTLLLCGLAFVLISGGHAAGSTLITTSGVNLRAEPSTNAKVVRTVGEGASVEVFSHDPVGWSKVRVNEFEGFIRSDFLTIPSGGSVTFKTTDGINMRAEPSTKSDRVRGISAGVNVEVLTHDPDPKDGWSKISYEGSEGYVKSEYLTLAALASQSSSENGGSSGNSGSSGGSNDKVTTSAPAPTTLRTNTAARMRSGPGTDKEVVKVLGLGTSVEVVEQSKNGWTKVKHGGSTGYIRSDLLGVGNNKVELLTMSQLKTVIKSGDKIQIFDVRTGISFTIRAFSVGRHADSEPLTKADTEAMSKIVGGKWSWNARPVWATVNGRTFAAALPFMPHAGSTIGDNGMNGHVCLHFADSVANNQSYQADLRKAVQEAWNAAKR